MGAVASLLYTAENPNSDVVFQILDSPFSSFDHIARHHAEEIFKFPSMFIDLGIGILKEHFKDHQYNPFRIDAVEMAKHCKVPSLFIYCEDDKIIPSTNSLAII